MNISINKKTDIEGGAPATGNTANLSGTAASGTAAGQASAIAASAAPLSEHAGAIADASPKTPAVTDASAAQLSEHAGTMAAASSQTPAVTDASAAPLSANAEGLKVPASVAIIMDGNGRWAKKRGLPRTMGHKEGCKTVEQIIEDAGEIGIKYLTVYAFSTENWNRSSDEVGALMDLFRFYAKRLLKRAGENNVRIRMIGDRKRFPEDIIRSINELEAATAANTGLTFVMAANYGGRDEIRRAAMKYAEAAARGDAPAEITEQDFAGFLDTKDIPDPDLLIRTSGELRISNFLSWQCAYSEFVFTDVLWPDFDKAELIRCIKEYNGRSRRFGGV